MIFNKQELYQAVTDQNWQVLIHQFTPKEIVDSYPYTGSMHIVGYLLLASSEESLDGQIADLFRDFAVNAMIFVRKKYPEEWWNDWKNEAFLGGCCRTVYREREAFEYCKNAYEHLQDPPQSLILSYVSSGQGPDHFLSHEQVMQLAEQALKKGITYEGALLMASLASRSGDKNNEKYWDQQAAETNQKGYHTPIITPNVLKNIFPVREGTKNED